MPKSVAIIVASSVLGGVGWWLGDFINLGTGQGYSVLQVIDTAGRVSGCKIPFEAIERRPGHPAVLIASNEKARQVLGWQPRYP